MGAPDPAALSLRCRSAAECCGDQRFRSICACLRGRASDRARSGHRGAHGRNAHGFCHLAVRSAARTATAARHSGWSDRRRPILRRRAGPGEPDLRAHRRRTGRCDRLGPLRGAQRDRDRRSGRRIRHGLPVRCRTARGIEPELSNGADDSQRGHRQGRHRWPRLPVRVEHRAPARRRLGRLSRGCIFAAAGTAPPGRHPRWKDVRRPRFGRGTNRRRVNAPGQSRRARRRAGSGTLRSVERHRRRHSGLRIRDRLPMRRGQARGVEPELRPEPDRPECRHHEDRHGRHGVHFHLGRGRPDRRRRRSVADTILHAPRRAGAPARHSCRSAHHRSALPRWRDPAEQHSDPTRRRRPRRGAGQRVGRGAQRDGRSGARRRICDRLPARSEPPRGVEPQLRDPDRRSRTS